MPLWLTVLSIIRLPVLRITTGFLTQKLQGDKAVTAKFKRQYGIYFQKFYLVYSYSFDSKRVANSVEILFHCLQKAYKEQALIHACYTKKLKINK